MRILFTGGGTGGHFYPIVAVARQLKGIIAEERLLHSRLYYIGPDDFGHDILQKDGIETIQVLSGKWRRYGSLQNIIDVFKIIAGTVKAFIVLFTIMPDVIFSKGGYGSIPVVCVAALYRIPLIIHESDSVIGLANRFASRFAERIAVSFESTVKLIPKKSSVALVGNPIRQTILGGSKESAVGTFAISTHRPVVLVVGGSQGSEMINFTVTGALRELLGDFEILHQTGDKHFDGIKSKTRTILKNENQAAYHPFPFFNDDELKNAYAIADIIVSRAGAGSIFEIAAAGKPAILVPLKDSAQEHQKQNAYEYAGTGAAIVIEESNLTPNVLLNEIRKLIADENLRIAMSERARHFAKPNAAEAIAKEILKLGLH